MRNIINLHDMIEFLVNQCGWVSVLRVLIAIIAETNLSLASKLDKAIQSDSK